ncbi:MAG: ACP S-malonyltransferase, partial [Gammaproteobacteria bacterium]
MTFAAVFPGQGSQAVGMLAAFDDSYPQTKQTFREASENLGYDLWALVQQGPEDRLNATERTQPALLTAGVALWRVWQSRNGLTP